MTERRVASPLATWIMITVCGWRIRASNNTRSRAACCFSPTVRRFDRFSEFVLEPARKRESAAAAAAAEASAAPRPGGKRKGAHVAGSGGGGGDGKRKAGGGGGDTGGADAGGEERWGELEAGVAPRFFTPREVTRIMGFPEARHV